MFTLLLSLCLSVLPGSGVFLDCTFSSSTAQPGQQRRVFSPIHCSLSLLPKRLRQSVRSPSPPVWLAGWLVGGVLHWIAPPRPCVSAAAAAAEPGIEPLECGAFFFMPSLSMVIIQLHARRAPHGTGWLLLHAICLPSPAQLLQSS